MSSEEEIKVQRCRNSSHCVHRLLIDMPQRDVREIQEGREIPLTVDLARLPRYLDLLEECFKGKELASKLEQAKIDGFTLDCGDYWTLNVSLPARLSLTVRFHHPGLGVALDWKGTCRFMSVDQMHQLLQALFFKPADIFCGHLSKHGLVQYGSHRVPTGDDPASVALRSIGLVFADHLNSYGDPPCHLARWMLVDVSVARDGSIKYKDSRLHSWDDEDLIPVKDVQEMRLIINSQHWLTFPEFYNKYLERKKEKPSRKRKAPKRWGFDEQ
jgi:hypothetical protein